MGQQFDFICCMKTVCEGCVMAAEEAAVRFGSTDLCPYCRAPPPRNHDEVLAFIQKRMDAGDAEAYNKLGQSYYLGLFGLTKIVLELLSCTLKQLIVVHREHSTILDGHIPMER